MKTIFITIFEGVESKNILRTPVFEILMKRKDIRLVLFTKNKKRLEYLKKEFNDPRVFYEVVENPAVMGFDGLFRKFKYTLLRTETTKLRRRMDYDMRGNYVSYQWSNVINWLLARPVVLAAVRFLDYRLVRDRVYAKYFAKYRPDLVFLANLFDEREVHFLREAKKNKVKTIGFINTWDRVSGRCILRIVPDHLVVFNDLIKEDLMLYNNINPDIIFTGGIPQYDQYFSLRPNTREEYFRGLNLPADTKLIVYSPIGSAFSNSDWDMMDLLNRLAEEGKFGNNIKILVRFPPNDFIDPKDLNNRPKLLYTYPGTRFSEKRGVDWDMDFAELKYLADTLYHMSILVCYASSISIDGSVFNKPVINLNFEIRPHEALCKSPTQFYAMAHYKKALDHGGIRLAGSEEDLIGWVKKYLADPMLDSAGRRKLVESQCKFVDGKSGERIGNFILENL
ncbi:MAG: CDP-glycerol glycerophosphotransferase family protein [Candidatus Sungbacteria bacterium]|nr:CDP-glycerol glycerophosphotransferase family protein [Candidatus Sungbacteria bacterium]